MAGTSRTNIEAFYGELSGVVASQWGEDNMATLDDKLHWNSKSTWFSGFSHNNTAARTYTVPDVSGTVAMWNADNSTVTRYKSWDYHGLAITVDSSGGSLMWSIDDSNDWVENSSTPNGYFGVEFPDGATITAFRVWCQTPTGSMVVELFRASLSGTDGNQLALINGDATMQEQNDLVISDPVIDNANYGYYVKFGLGGSGEKRVRGIRIDYTVVKPQP